jgi:diadenosine tetraphosphate (Ap4A) HIT family hydrolase
MSTEELRRDSLTGVLSIHPDQHNKPFPVVRRTLPDPGEHCVFCDLAAAPVNENNDIENGDDLSHLQRNSRHSLVIANRWSPFGPLGGADLVIARRHVTDLESLGPDESEDFVTALLEVRARHRDAFRRTLAFVNVGLEVNGTQPHLHGQVVSTNIDAHAPVSIAVTAASLAEDVSRARHDGLVVHDSPDAITYVAWAPTTTGEIRIVAQSPETLAAAVHAALTDLVRAYGTLAYNIVLLEGPRLVAQVLPRFTAVGVLPPYFGIAVIMIPPSDVAAALGGR